MPSAIFYTSMSSTWVIRASRRLIISLDFFCCASSFFTLTSKSVDFTVNLRIGTLLITHDVYWSLLYPELSTILPSLFRFVNLSYANFRVAVKKIVTYDISKRPYKIAVCKTDHEDSYWFTYEGEKSWNYEGISYNKVLTSIIKGLS